MTARLQGIWQALQRCWPARYLLLAVAGLLQAWSLAWPWGGQTLGWLQVCAMAMAMALLASPDICGGLTTAWVRFRAGFLRGWFFATVWLSAVFWWLYVSMHTYGGLASWLAVLAVLLLASLLGLAYGLACGLWLCVWANRGVQLVLFSALWLLAELFRGTFLSGFPWGAIGYAHMDSALLGFAPWVGVYGMSAIAAAVAGLVWLLCMGLVQGQQKVGRRYRAIFLTGLLGIGLAGFALKNLQEHTVQAFQNSRALNVALLQGNIAQNEKFIANGGEQTALQWYGEQMQAQQSALIVLPETALPIPPDFLPEGYWSGLRQHFATASQAALIGVPVGNSEIGFANAVVGLVPGGARVVGDGVQHDLALPDFKQPAYGYIKHHLVPFGEFIPTGFGWFVRMMNIPLGDLQRGQLVQPRLLFQGERIAPNICYEDLFGEELAANFTDSTTAPTILVNLSNIAWFGDTVAIDQHRHISRMRAVELARPMLRATNTGATAVIGPTGKVEHELPRLTRAVLSAPVHGVDGYVTFYAQWVSRWGLWPLWIAGCSVVVACYVWAQKK